MQQSEEQVLETWEPKVNSMLRNTSIIGMDREDIAQELRIAILKAWRGYDDSRKVKFHTYVHVAMLNVLRSLISKAQKHVATQSLDEQAEDYKDSSVSNKILAALEDEGQAEAFKEVDLLSLLQGSGLTELELDFLDLRVQRYKLAEISEILEVPAGRLRNSIKKKIEWRLIHDK